MDAVHVSMSALLAARDAVSWNLVTGGPSRVHLRPEHLLDGPVVTVNRAIDVIDQGIGVDIAALADGPQNFDTFGLRHRWHPGMILWVHMQPALVIATDENGKKVRTAGPPMGFLWDSKLPASVGMRFMPSDSLLDLRTQQKVRNAFTTYCAFIGIQRYAPRTIRILSMDMQGAWHPGLTEEQCVAADEERLKLNRWEHERFHMEHAIAEARAKGIRVEMVTPAPAEALEESLDGAVVH